MGIFKSKPKINLYARLSYTKQTRAEVTKNLFKDKKMLDEVLSKEGSYFKAHDFSFIDFENDDDKVFKIFLMATIKDTTKLQNKLESDLKDIFDCNDVEISKSIDDFNRLAKVVDNKKKDSINNIGVNHSNNVQNAQNNVSNNGSSSPTTAINVSSSNETIDSVIKDKNQIPNNNNQQNINNNGSQASKDNSNYQKPFHEKDDEDKTSSNQPTKEFKYF